MATFVHLDGHVYGLGPRLFGCWAGLLETGGSVAGDRGVLLGTGTHTSFILLGTGTHNSFIPRWLGTGTHNSFIPSTLANTSKRIDRFGHVRSPGWARLRTSPTFVIQGARERHTLVNWCCWGCCWVLGVLLGTGAHNTFIPSTLANIHKRWALYRAFEDKHSHRFGLLVPVPNNIRARWGQAPTTLGTGTHNTFISSQLSQTLLGDSYS
ncbi:hypothetical protein SCOR_28535 [Sulfidibacter corallicola]